MTVKQIVGRDMEAPERLINLEDDQVRGEEY
ncbi:hypothetical protein AVEN_109405-1, partial [Araneus ventricosus]